MGAPAAGEATPTRVRARVVRYAVLLAVITYVDRVAIAQAEGPITRAFRLTPTEMGSVFAAFTWAYALFEIPGGWLGDRFGARRVLTRIVLWWSFFTAATGWVWSYGSLLATRALFGAGEAGCFPNLTRALRSWLPRNERARAQGLVWLAARWGGAFTPLVVFGVLQLVSWRAAFSVFAVLGVVWVVFFRRFYRDDPAAHPEVSAAELRLIASEDAEAARSGGVPWRRFLTSRTVWLLWLQYAFLSYGWWFYITWLPRYLREARGLDLKESAVLAALPLFLGGIGCIVSGSLAEPAARWLGGVARARRLFACLGFGGASALLVVSVSLQDPVAAMLAMGMASFFNDVTMPGSWAACMDVGGRYAGTLSGGMNTMGNIGGGLGPLVTGALLQATHGNWSLTLIVSAAVYLGGVAAWLFIDPVTPLDRGPA